MINNRKMKIKQNKLREIILRNKRYSLFPIFLLFIDLYVGALYAPFFLDCPLNAPSKSTSNRSTSVIYFVHGYAANNSQFQQMIDFLYSRNFFLQYNDNSPRYFDYLAKYLSQCMTSSEVHNFANSIFIYATDFYLELVNTNLLPTRVDIIAHSLGGLIVREMLRIYRDQLEYFDIFIDRVITLGTPHLGTKLASHPIKEPLTIFIGDDWDTKTINLVIPKSHFLTVLNTDPENYMENIQWFFVAGVSSDPVCYLSKRVVFDGVSCDGFVDWQSALGIGIDIDYLTRLIIERDHTTLLEDSSNEIYHYISLWLHSGIRIIS
jgi:pimeloyl-ACP methyl ester carboxylesterase